MSDQCPFCDFGSSYEYGANDHFQYGVDEDAVMLCARVVIIACTRCSMKYTDHRSEDARQKVVEDYLMKDANEFNHLEEFMKNANEKSRQHNEQLDGFFKDEANFKQFFIGTHELKALLDWKVDHDKTCPYYDDGTKDVSPQGAIGGRTTYSFTPTGIGVAVSVSCACGVKKNITDYESW